MKLGNVATGADFFNRVTDLVDIWDKISDDHLILSGPRRLGKSSVLYKLKEQATEHGYNAEIVDVQGVDDAQGFIDCIFESFPTKSHSATSFMTKFNPFKSVKKIDAKVMGQGGGIEFLDTKQRLWQEDARKIFDHLASDKYLILVDEFSVFLEKFLQRNPDEAVDFLDWLRKWRINQGSLCKFVFTGSIGLTTLLETYDLVPQMNDCDDYVLKQFRQIHAVEMLQRFARDKNVEINEENSIYICERIGWLSPFFLNLLLNESMVAARDRLLEETTAINTSTDGLKVILKQDINDAYERLLASRSRFSHWETRLKKQLNKEEFGFCKSILSHIAKSESGLNMVQLSARLQSTQPDLEQREQLLQRLLFRLTEEGYLSPPCKEGKIQYLSFILKDYWKRNHA